MCLGVADTVTDGITCGRLLHGDVVVPNEGYKKAYVVVLCFGVVASLLSLGYRLHNARLVRAQLLKLGRQGRAESTSDARRQLQQNEWELTSTHRAKVILSLALLSVVLQGAMQRRDALNARSLHGVAPVRLRQMQGCRCPSSIAI